MSFTFGFYNSIEHDRLYDAIQVSKIFDGIILDGVYATVGEAFIVQAAEEPNLVVIGPGRAWFDHTWNENDGYLEVELSPPETILDRIDMIVIDVKGGLNRVNDILVVKGTPSSTPTNPPLIREPEHNQYPLCYILRKASEESVSQANITNAVGTSDCPFVTGVLEGLDVDLMLLQWKAAWAEFIQACQDHIDEWEDAAKEDVAKFIEAFKIQCNEFISETEAWQTIQKEDFRKFYNEFKSETIIYEEEWVDWVDHLKDILDQDALGHLLLEMEKMKADVEKQIENTRAYLDELISGFQAKTTDFLDDGSIVQTYPDGSTITTVFLSDGSIEETLRASNGVVGAVKVTEFVSDTQIVERVVGGNYPEFALSKATGVGEYINKTYNLGNEAFNDIQSIRDVANSEEMMTAIVESADAWDGLSKSPTAMTAFLASDVAMTIFAAHDNVLKTLVERELDTLITKPILVTGVVNHRAVLKFIFDDPDLQKKFLNETRMINALRDDSVLKELYTVADTSAAPFYLKDGKLMTLTLEEGEEEPTLGQYTWAVGFSLYSDQFGTENAGDYRITTSIYPTGEEGETYKYIYAGDDVVTIQSMVIRIADAISYVTVKPEISDVEFMQLVAF